jgi:hypothetical protein
LDGVYKTAELINRVGLRLGRAITRRGNSLQITAGTKPAARAAQYHRPNVRIVPGLVQQRDTLRIYLRRQGIAGRRIAQGQHQAGALAVGLDF